MTAKERIDYYRDGNVRDRIIEFLGGDSGHPPTCRYILACDDSNQPHERHSITAFESP